VLQAAHVARNAVILAQQRVGVVAKGRVAHIQRSNREEVGGG
jgi:hypothetical protein